MSFNQKRKKGMTLAEVLITLSIIGMIAAMTVPVFIDNVYNSSNYAGLQKIYSVLGNAYKMILISDGPIDEWGELKDRDINGTRVVSDKFISKMRVSKICYNQPGCWASTPISTLNLRGQITGSSATGIGGDVVSFTLQDGMNISIDVYENLNDLDNFGVQSGVDGKMVAIWVDVNGSGAPNVMGRDVFAFVLDVERGVVPAGSTKNTWCNVSQYSIWGGTTCAYKALKEHGIKY